MKELTYCTNTRCWKEHCLCHYSREHWKDKDKRLEVDVKFNDGKTPCEGYIPQFERKKYNIKF